MVDASTGAKAPAFDHEKLAASLSKAANASYTAVTLPFNTIGFADHDQAIEVAAAEFKWKCSLSDYTCQKQGPAPAGLGRRGGVRHRKIADSKRRRKIGPSPRRTRSGKRSFKTSTYIFDLREKPRAPC